jgi:hypothetical protein
MANPIPPKRSPAVERVVGLVELLGPRTVDRSKPVQPAPQIDRESIPLMIEQVVRRLLAELGDPPPQDEPKDDPPAPPKRLRKPRKRKSSKATPSAE